MTSEGRCLLHNEKQTKLSGVLYDENTRSLKKVCCADVFYFSNRSQFEIKGNSIRSLGLNINLVGF